ncbi:MAG: transposase [Stellaceae bacterium]
MTVPGIGALSSLAYVSTVEDPRRFSRSRAVGAHLGLTPRRHRAALRSRQGAGSLGAQAVRHPAQRLAIRRAVSLGTAGLGSIARQNSSAASRRKVSPPGEGAGNCAVGAVGHVITPDPVVGT